jgi:hypothetical protein
VDQRRVDGSAGTPTGAPVVELTVRGYETDADQVFPEVAPGSFSEASGS